VCATLAPAAVLGPEAVIENIYGVADRITIGPRSFVRGRLLTYGHGGQITIGEWCYVGVRTEIWSMDRIEIGDRVMIAHDVNIHDGMSHSLDATDRHSHFRHILERGHPNTWQQLPGISSAPVIIEHDVWIGLGATILQGVRIGARSVIGARSIVTEDVPPDVLYRCDIGHQLISLSGLRGQSDPRVIS
jgi:maltose O-acetyltransferase